jgi:hypothetical protein
VRKSLATPLGKNASKVPAHDMHYTVKMAVETIFQWRRSAIPSLFSSDVFASFCRSLSLALSLQKGQPRIRSALFASGSSLRLRVMLCTRHPPQRLRRPPMSASASGESMRSRKCWPVQACLSVLGRLLSGNRVMIPVGDLLFLNIVAILPLVP